MTLTRTIGAAVVFGALCAVAAGCPEGPREPTAAGGRGAGSTTPAVHSQPGAGTAAEPAAGMPLPPESIYHAAGDWTDQDGRPLALASLRGRPVIVSMIFSRCAGACPRTIADLKGIQERLPTPLLEGTRFLLLSFDSARDDPERLRTFARERGLAAGRYTLARAAPEDVRTAAALLGVRYQLLEGGDFAHSNRITLLDAEGRIVHVLDGLGVDPAPLVGARLRLGGHAEDRP